MWHTPQTTKGSDYYVSENNQGSCRRKEGVGKCEIRSQ
jgi:hypothetical protein